MRTLSPRNTSLKDKKNKNENKANFGGFYKSSGIIRVPIPLKSHPLRQSLLLGNSGVSHGKKAKVTATVQTSGSPDYDACGFILRQQGKSGAECPTTEGCWGLPQGCICGSFPPVVHVEEECFRDDKEQENKNSHKGKEKCPH